MSYTEMFQIRTIKLTTKEIVAKHEFVKRKNKGNSTYENEALWK